MSGPIPAQAFLFVRNVWGKDEYRPAAVEVNVVRTTTMRSRGEAPGKKKKKKKKKKMSGRFRTIVVSPFIVGLYAPFGPTWLRLQLRRRTVQLPAEPHVVSCLGTPQREMLAAALIGSMTETVLEVGSKRETVTRGSLANLVHGHWIGDEVINAFLVVLQVSARDALCTEDGVREIQSYSNTGGGNGNPGSRIGASNRLRLCETAPSPHPAYAFLRSGTLA